jgi:hypothetical protein
MPQHHPLTVTVNDQLTIDAGYWQECVKEDQTPYRLISPRKPPCTGRPSRIWRKRPKI